MKKDNPWLGLRTYEEGDTIYGRLKEIQELSQDIIYNIQTTIYGKSGIGKSSILNAGVIPILRKRGFFPVKIRLEHKRAELSYVKQIIKAVFQSLGQLKKEQLDENGKIRRIPTVGSFTELCKAINPDSEGLWEFFHRHKFYDEENNPIKPVLIIDQFEELFTLTKESVRAEAIDSLFGELADIINNIKPDYIYKHQSGIDNAMAVGEGENSASPAASEPDDEMLLEEDDINPTDNLYLVENNCHIVISIREDFLSYLERNINDIPQLKNNRYCLTPLSEDQAAEIIMSPRHGLVSVEVAKEIITKITGVSSDSFEINDVPEIEVDSAILSLFLSEIYEKTDGDIITKKDIDDYGVNVVQEYYENIIKKISTDSVEYLERRLITNEGRRDNIRKNRALERCVTEDELDILKEARLIREFPWNDEMRIEFIHDVLCNTIVKRREERKKLKLQQETELLLKQNAEKLRKRNRLLLNSTVCLLLSIVVVSFSIWDGMFHEIETRYRFVVKKNGWFEGLNKLSKNESSYLDCHYVLKKKGRWSKYPYAMEARNGYDSLTTEHNFGAYILNQYDDTDSTADRKMKEKLSQVCKWRFIPDRSGEFVVQEQAMDKFGNIVFSYNRSKTKDENKVISTYMDETGFPIILRDSCYFYLLTTYNEQGYEALIEFYDDKGNPIPNKDGAFKTRRTYLSNGMKKSEASLFLSGERMIDRWGNCGYVETKYLDGDSLYVTETVSFNADSIPAPIILEIFGGGVVTKRYEYDEHCRVKSQTFWDADGKPMIDVMGVHGVKCEYNRHGRQTHSYRIDTLGRITKDIYGYIDIHREYDQWGNMIMEEGVISDDSVYAQMYKYNAHGLLLSQKQYRVYGNDTIVSFRYTYDENNRTYLKEWLDPEYYVPYCVRGAYDEYGRQILWAYYDVTNTVPIEVFGYHMNRTEYEYGNGKMLFTDSFYDKKGHRTVKSDNWWSYLTCEVDSVNKTKLILYYDSLGKFVLGNNSLCTNDFTKVLRYESVSENGDVKRTSNNAMFYYSFVNCYNAKANKNETVACYYLNEYNEPAYVRESSDGLLTVYGVRYGNSFYDEKGLKIDPSKLEKSSFVVPIIELRPNIEYFGFKDGDVLLKCGKWNMNSMYDNLSEWKLPQLREFYVARFNKDKIRHEIVKVKIDASVNIFNAINAQKYYCTEKEEIRFKELYATLDTLSQDAIMEEYISVGDSTHSIVLGRVEKAGKMKDMGLYGEYIVLKWCDWTHKQSIDEFAKEFELKKNSEKEVMLLPIKDNKGTMTLGKIITIKAAPDELLGIRVMDSSVSIHFYNENIKELCNFDE